MALINCPKCQKQISDTVSLCIHCGCQIISCPDCGAAINAEDELCTACGHSFKAQTPPIPEQPEVPEVDDLPGLVSEMKNFKKKSKACKAFTAIKWIFAIISILSILPLATGFAMAILGYIEEDSLILGASLALFLISLSGFSLLFLNSFLSLWESILVKRGIENTEFSIRKTYSEVDSAKLNPFTNIVWLYLPIALVLGSSAKRKGIVAAVFQCILPFLAPITVIVILGGILISVMFENVWLYLISFVIIIPFLACSLISNILARSFFDSLRCTLQEQEESR